MLITPATLRAFTLAQEAHKGQVDKGGHPYIEHVMSVASKMREEAATVVALLHDILEDTDLTEEDLRKAGISERAIRSIRLLTRPADTTYLSYIESLREDPIAVKVKLADLQHNSDLSRIPHPTDWDIRRCERYQKAIRILSEKASVQ